MRARWLASVLAASLALSLLSAPTAQRLEAKGSRGWIKFWGDGTVEISGRGSLTIKDASRQTLEIKGKWGEMKKLADGAEYTDFEGKVHSVGMGIFMELRGWDLALSHRGVRGKAKFRGEGTVTLNDAPPQAWVDDPNEWLKLEYP